MRNVDNAVSDSLYDVGYEDVDFIVHADANQPNARWVIELTRRQRKMVIEVIQGDPHVFACVLRNDGFSLRFRDLFMDALMDNLEDD
jgi:hypothetical protein